MVSTHTGVTVNEQTALGSSIVWACTRLISESAASVSLQIFERQDKGRKKVDDHPLYRLLHDAPNEFMGAMEFRELMTAKCLLWGNAYALKAFRSDGSGNLISLWPIHPSAVSINWKTPDRKDFNYIVATPKGPMDVSRREMFHLRGLGDDGILGYSVIEKARQSIGLSLTLEEYGGKFFAKGGRPTGAIKYPGIFKDEEAFKRWRSRFDSTYAGSDDYHNLFVLEGGSEFQAFGLKPQDSQFLETRQFSIPEQCRWFLMKPHMVGDLTRATFSNIEQQSLEFVIYTLRPWLVRWEQAINRQLIRPSDQRAIYAEHNIDALLRGDFASRTTGYATALQNGYMSINEVRALENLNPIPGGDDYHIQLNMQTLPGGTPMTSELAALAKTKPEPAPEAKAMPLTVQIDARTEAKTKKVTKTILRNKNGHITGVIEDGE